MAQRILVVDDDKNIVRLVRSYLEQARFGVLVAYEGETAMHAIRRKLPDLVVLDLMLPGRDGWQIARWMREDKRLASIRTGMLPKSMGNDTLQPICSELYRFRVDV